MQGVIQYKSISSKKCTCCSQEKPICDFYTTGKKADGSPKYNSWCKSCISIKQSSYHKRTWGSKRLSYVAHKRTKDARSYLLYLLSKAKRRGDCSITIDHLEDIWNRQKGLCSITGWQMTMRLMEGVIPTNVSIDRIDSSVGYHVGNIQLVCRCVNIAKSDLTMDEFMKMCRAVVEGGENGA